MRGRRLEWGLSSDPHTFRKRIQTRRYNQSTGCWRSQTQLDCRCVGFISILQSALLKILHIFSLQRKCSGWNTRASIESGCLRKLPTNCQMQRRPWQRRIMKLFVLLRHLKPRNYKLVQLPSEKMIQINIIVSRPMTIVPLLKWPHFFGILFLFPSAVSLNESVGWCFICMKFGNCVLIDHLTEITCAPKFNFPSVRIKSVVPISSHKFCVPRLCASKSQYKWVQNKVGFLK